MKTLLLEILAVGSGGFLGSTGRFLLGGWVDRRFREVGLPLGTLTVNVLGCLVIGVVMAWALGRGTPDRRMLLLVVTGILGGFTTFSSFGYECLVLFQEGQPGRALLTIGLNLALGLGAVWLGHQLASR